MRHSNIPAESDCNFAFSQGRFWVDNHDNLHIRTSVIINTDLSSAYYNQYVISLGQNMNTCMPSATHS
ncbi:hypothetical protein [Chryseobacterium sp.]|uniref:hypothetical protein n=1 Tax=Chryseobacterium sp. TaxID=1871047 RepID=UPI00388F11BD